MYASTLYLQHTYPHTCKRVHTYISAATLIHGATLVSTGWHLGQSCCQYVLMLLKLPHASVGAVTKFVFRPKISRPKIDEVLRGSFTEFLLKQRFCKIGKSARVSELVYSWLSVHVGVGERMVIMFVCLLVA